MSNRTKIILAVIVLAIIGWWYCVSQSFMQVLSVPKATVVPVSETTSVEAVVRVGSSASLGDLLVASNGMTLYIKKGELGSSSCYGVCISNWPPLRAPQQLFSGSGVSGRLGILARTDGINQVTYNGSPLYYYVNDKKLGDALGDGFGGVWSTIKP